MDAVVEHPGELEYANKEDMIERIVNSSPDRIQMLSRQCKDAKVKRLAVAMAMRDSRDVLSLLRLSKSLVGPLTWDGRIELLILPLPRQLKSLKT